MPAARQQTRGERDSAPLPDEVPISDKERAQWLLHRLVPGRGICNIAITVRIERQLRWWPLQQALNHLVRRHAALRTLVDFDHPVPHKRYAPAGEQTMTLTTHGVSEQALPELLSALAAEPFELTGELLVRAHLVLLPTASVVVLVTHHLVTDHTSNSLLLSEMARLYDRFAADAEPPPELAGPAPPYLEPPPAPQTVDYWVRHLSGVDPDAMVLAGARSITGRPTFTGARIEHRLPADVVAAVAAIQERTKVTRNVVMLAAFYLLLARHGAGPRIVVGIPVAGRRGIGGDVVGFHSRTLPVCVDVDDDIAVAELVRRTCWAFLEGLERDDASFEAVQAALPDRSGDWRVPLFRHSFNFRPPSDGRLPMAGLTARAFEVHKAMSRLDLEWIVFSSEKAIDVAVLYSTEVHDTAFARALYERYTALLLEMAAAVTRPLAEISGWSPADLAAHRPLTATERPRPERTVLDEVRARAAERPGAAAMRHAGRTVTYRELLTAADGIRGALRQHGLAPGEVVALHAERGPGLAAAALGVWAAGGGYLPLDPGHPAARLADQLDDAGVRLVLGDVEPDPAILRGRVWLPLAEAADGPTAELADPAGPDVAYLIYTSGSTGRPKGVEVTHDNLANLVADFAERLAVSPEDRTLWLTTFSFDISALELFLPLATGGTVVVAPDEDRLTAQRLLALVDSERVDVLQATPTTWRHLLGGLRGQLTGRRVLCGGEPLSADLAERLLAAGCRLFNVYGPTETTIWSTAVELRSPVPDPVPIGLPVANTTVLVCRPDGRPVPTGVPGELRIGGAGVAVGYRGRPELTAERFVPDPRLGRCYRTGDRVRLTEDGLVFLDRLDRQVKVRGHRVEPGEVEAALQSHPAVRAAVVTAEPDGAGHSALVAAVQPVDGAVTGEELRAHLALRLPAAAVPSRYVLVPRLPLTGNGKLDRRALAEQIAGSGTAPPLPDDQRLRRLVRLWREVLGDERLGADANFFLNGGHSLLAVALAERIAAATGREVGFDAVFDAPSPRQFLAWLGEPEAVR